MTYNAEQRRKQSNTIQGKGNPHWKGGKILKDCVRCGSPFLVYPCKKDTQLHCSLKCANRDIADTRRGIANPKTSRYGKDNFFFGKDFRGAKNGNWKGGITPANTLIRGSAEFKQWRDAVFERDNWTCQKCGAKSGKGKEVYLEGHHIKSFAKYPELRFEVSNGQTLCLTCHKKTFSIEASA